MKLGILTSHPIQYQTPWLRALAPEVDLTTYFAHRPNAAEQGAGFGVAFDWDMDLLSGYSYEFLNNVARHPSVNRFSGCDTPEIRQAIHAGKFDAFIVSGWYLKAYWQAVISCRNAGVPVLVRGDSHLGTPRSFIKRWIKEVAYRLLLRQFDGFLVVGKRNEEYLRHFGVPSRLMFSVPHFVDNQWFVEKADHARRFKAQMRKKWGADDETLVALFVGKFQGIKRPHDLLNALARLKKQSQPKTCDVKQSARVKFIAVFVGAGEMDTALRNLASSLRVNACFDGFRNQTELPSYYAAADVLVLPSESETWGLVVNEAMACDCPVIVSDAVGCAPDLVEHGRTGFTYPVGDVETLAERLKEMSARKRMGSNWREPLSGKLVAYSVEAAVSGTLLALDTILRQNRTRTRRGSH